MIAVVLFLAVNHSPSALFGNLPIKKEKKGNGPATMTSREADKQVERRIKCQNYERL